MTDDSTAPDSPDSPDRKKDIHIGRLICVELTTGRTVEIFNFVSANFPVETSPNKPPYQYPYECLTLAHDQTNLYLLVRGHDKLHILSLDQFGRQRWIKTLLSIHMIGRHIPHLEIKNDQLVIYGLNHDLYHNCNQYQEEGLLMPDRVDDKTGQHLMRTIDHNNEFVYSRVTLSPEDKERLSSLPIRSGNAWTPLITKDPYGRLYGNHPTIKGKINFFG